MITHVLTFTEIVTGNRVSRKSSKEEKWSGQKIYNKSILKRA